MAQVDPADDSLWRWVVFHYRFVPERNQRGNALVAAFDNETEQVAAIEERATFIRREVAAGTRDPKENVSGATWHPGYHAEQGFGRPVESAIHHGVDADGESWSFGGVPYSEPEEAVGGEPGNLTDKEPTEDSAAPTLLRSADFAPRKRQPSSPVSESGGPRGLWGGGTRGSGGVDRDPAPGGFHHSGRFG